MATSNYSDEFERDAVQQISVRGQSQGIIEANAEGGRPLSRYRRELLHDIDQITEGIDSALGRGGCTATGTPFSLYRISMG